jgi:acetyltransferase
VSTYRLDKLFAPASIAVIGASPRENSLGRYVLRSLRDANYRGQLSLINPRYREIEGMPSVASIDALPHTPDLVVVTAPAAQVPDIIAACGAKGCAAAIILSAGLGHGPGSLSEATARTARTYGIRLIGPNCLGVLVPPVNINASFAARQPPAGDLALISQSGAIAAGLVEWGARQGIGFSAMVSLGDQIDVDFGDLLDYFALDQKTRAILMYVESINDARKFMSAARAAARVKPVVVIKSGRHAQGAKAAATHTGALAGSDAVYDAAFRRAGLLRVYDLDELFAAAEVLGRIKSFPGNRLAILTNGGGIGVLAVDRLIDLGGSLAAISPDTLARLDAKLPPIWSHANPADIAGDAPAERYKDALAELLADTANDAVMAMNVPTALASPRQAARTVSETVARYRRDKFNPKPVMAVWLGADAEVSSIFDTANIPHFETEADAVAGFMHMVRYRDAVDTLMQTPPDLSDDFAPDTAKARQIVEGAVAAGRTWLNPIEVTGLLDAYRIPVVPAVLARDADEAVRAAAPFLDAGTPVVAKILSQDIVHKSEVGGVRLNLGTPQAVHDATAEILTRARAARSDARIDGVTIHPMILRPKSREILAGVATDPTFGPVIVFGHGGTAVEVINDKTLALPPLDMHLARDMIARTRISRILKAYRDVPAADESAIALVLVKLAQLIADIPGITELDLNPMLADQSGILAVDARVAVRASGAVPSARNWRMAIRPYPKTYEKRVTLKDGAAILIRPVRPEDEPLFPDFFKHVTAEDVRLRFFGHIKNFDHTFIARLTQIDYARAMCFLAIDPDNGDMLGAVRLHSDSKYESGEYAVLVRSDLKGRGLGWLLMQSIIDYATAEGLRTITGRVLNENTMMLAMCRELGFEVRQDPEETSVQIVTLTVPSQA